MGDAALNQVAGDAERGESGRILQSGKHPSDSGGVRGDERYRWVSPDADRSPSPDWQQSPNWQQWPRWQQSPPWPPAPPAPYPPYQPRPPRRRLRVLNGLGVLIVFSVWAMLAWMQFGSHHGSSSHLAIPASCLAPPALATASTTTDPPTAQEFAAVADHNVLTDFDPTMASPQTALVNTETPSTFDKTLDAPLISHHPGLQTIATGRVGYGTPNQVLEETEVQQFTTDADAVAYNQRIYEVRCAEGEDPNTASSTMPGEFLEPQSCGCTGGQGYAEMSMVIGRFRVGVMDYNQQRTDTEVARMAQTVLASASEAEQPQP